MRLGDVATVTDSVEDIRTAGLSNGKPAVLLIIFRQPGANIIETVDRVRALLPQLQAAIPPGHQPRRSRSTRTRTIRASVRDVEITLVDLDRARDPGRLPVPAQRRARRSSRASPCRSRSIGTFGVMYLLGYSIDNLSLMALTIATGFVVDDAIVVIENITRHLEEGMPPLEAALRARRRSASPSSRSASR